MERALHENLDYLQAVLDSTNDALFVNDADTGQIIDVNRRMCELYGYTREEALRLPISDLSQGEPPYSQAEALAWLVKAREIGPQTIEWQAKRKDGQLFWAEVSIRFARFGSANRFVVMVRDITDRKQVEQSLRESQQLFALFMRHSPIYTFIKSVTPTESRVLQASENFRDMIGVLGSEMADKTMAELFPAEFAAKISADDWAVVSKGEVLNLDEDLNGRNYTTIKFPIVLGDKTLLAGYTIDITDRKRAEEKLRDSERRLKQAESAVHLGYYELDLQTGTALWSDETFRLFDLDPASGEPTFETYRQLIHPADADLLYQRLAESIETRQRFDLTYRIHVAGGGQRFVHSLGDIHVGADNRLKLFGTLQDVTERVLAGEEAQRFAFIANAAAEFMTLVNPHHVIEAANDAYCRAQNRPRDQIIGRSLAEVWGEDRYREKISPRLAECFAGHIVRYEESFAFEDSEPAIIKWACIPTSLRPAAP